MATVTAPIFSIDEFLLQEREKDLHACDNDAQLACELLKVAVKPLQLRLTAPPAIHVLRIRHPDQR